jgi:uncharacterized protein
LADLQGGGRPQNEHEVRRLMDVTPLIPSGNQIIESYGPSRFRVSGRTFRGSILVFTDRTTEWNSGSLEGLTQESLGPVMEAGRAGKVELLILGCGTRMALLPGALRTALREVGIVIEPMDTGAACRTYNVLMAEGRKVAAALIVLP